MAYTLTNEFVWKEIGQQVVVLQFETGAYWTLNETASFAWKSILEGRSVDEVANQLAKVFDVGTDSAREDVKELLRSWVGKKMLTAE